MRPLQQGERVHLVDSKGRHYAITLRAGAVYQHSGHRIAHSDLIGKEEGILVTLSGGKRMWVFRPTLEEYVLKMPRGAQILYPKDIASILIAADVFPGATVAEAGIGSGSLTIALLRAVAPGGRVVAYEVREDFARRAIENIEQFLGKAELLTLRIQDVYAGIEERDVDRVILDLPEPWQVVPHAAGALRSGGLFACFLPTVPQVQQVTAALAGHGSFDQVRTAETLLRTWTIEGRSVRPDHRMVAHTGFITTARRITPP